MTMPAAELYETAAQTRPGAVDLRLLPAYLAVLSSVSLLWTYARNRGANGFGKSRLSTSSKAAVDGPMYFHLARLAGTLALLVISAFDVAVHATALTEITVMLYVYAAILSSFTVSAAAGSPLAHLVSRHLTLLLCLALIPYAYRDVWPLFTLTQTPVDLGEGRIMWWKIALLAVTGVILPLFAPRRHIPIQMKGVASASTPEQTASIFSLWTYSFIDQVVALPRQNSAVTAGMLPSLADYDHTEVLAHKGIQNLDIFVGAPHRHVFFGIMRTFGREYITVFGLLALRMVAVFFAPLGINGLLRYIETNGEGAVLRPIVWIILMFISSVTADLIWQRNIFIITTVMARARALLTYVVYEHSLRVRVDANTQSDDEPASTGAKSSPTSRRSPGVGTMINLTTTDLDNILDGRDFLITFFYSPVQMAFCLYFLYLLLGWSAFVGLAIMLLCFPIPGYITKFSQGIQRQVMRKTDARVQTVSEMMNVLRMVKLFGWEHKLADRVSSKRTDELQWIRTRELLKLANRLANLVIPVLQLITTYAVYTLVMRRELTPSVVFPSITLFDMLRNQLGSIIGSLPDIIQAKVSLDRLTEFLHSADGLLDEFSAKEYEVSAGQEPDDDSVVGFRDAQFTWDGSSEVVSDELGTQRHFSLNFPGSVVFERGCLSLITGPTGSGKTSVLMALLGEMHFTPTSSTSWHHLPRREGVSYAAQESWVLNDTIRGNIVFGADYDEERYRRVIYACALEPDLQLLAAGDMSEVGEKGITLSGGQKARVTLARAIYSQAQIVLLDDVLSALDAHTSRWIVEKCFKSDLVRGRTVLLVTHNVALAVRAADYIMPLRSGAVESYVRVEDTLLADATLSDEADQPEKSDESTTSDISDETRQGTASASDGKLILAEEIVQGGGVRAAMFMFYSAMGGRLAFVFWTTFLTCIAVNESLDVLQTFWLGHWAEQYDHRAASDVNVAYYLGILVGILSASFIIYSIGIVTYLTGVVRASRKIHGLLMNAVLGTTFRWLTVTPVSRVIARCTQDIRALDGPVPQDLRLFIEKSALLLTKLVAIIVVAPTFLLPSLIVFAVGWWCCKIHLRIQLPVMRIKSVANAPVIGHLGNSIAGLVSLRAYGAQEAFREELHRRVNEYTRVSRTSTNINRWLALRISSIGGLFSSGLGAYLIYGPGSQTILPSTIGFSLTMALGFSRTLLWWMRIINALEIDSNTLERLHAYIGIEQEPEPKKAISPPASWPTSGELIVHDLSASYSPDGPRVLHDLSFHVKSGERIGIVGRTGSGKTSLTLSLLRTIYTGGTVVFDGVDTGTIRLDDLRSKITIIPQSPELLSGTLRDNLDPFDEHDDAMLNAALRASGLDSLQADNGAHDCSAITLDTQIANGGSNLSVGQRQIIALARALVRESKLLVLDEATSSIDHKTDTVIQTSLREELGRDVTVLVVAHRLQTVMDADRIMVLDAGRLVEFDKPGVLLQRSQGYLKALVEESEDRDSLYAMASQALGGA
ncbi:P-loop containing nucleoside triphosphate hydrolase protein [Peniophora sp. CONT]|nr:P-loop containing nucleoside triphosphate hydrolase protein [Peniophora sp. CONT]